MEIIVSRLVLVYSPAIALPIVITFYLNFELVSKEGQKMFLTVALQFTYFLAVTSMERFFSGIFA